MMLRCFQGFIALCFVFGCSSGAGKDVPKILSFEAITLSDSTLLVCRATSVPTTTLILYKDGKVIDRTKSNGVKSEVELRRLIKLTYAYEGFYLCAAETTYSLDLSKPIRLTGTTTAATERSNATEHSIVPTTGSILLTAHEHLGTYCTWDGDCPIENSHCNKSRCTCYSDYEEVHNSSGSHCVYSPTVTTPAHEHLGTYCTWDGECPIENSHCNESRCTCYSDYEEVHNSSGSHCVYSPTVTTPGYRYLGTVCNWNSDCPIENSYCKLGRCSCNAGYQESVNSSGNLCVYSFDPTPVHRHLDTICNRNSDCPIENSYCRAGSCKCYSGYKAVHTIYGTQCDVFTTPISAPKRLGSRCSKNYECYIEYSYCYDRRCTCKLGYKLLRNATGDQCAFKGYQLGTQCSWYRDCPIENSYCHNGHCSCNSAFQIVANGTGQQCVYLPPKKIGDLCRYDLDCIPMDRNSFCAYSSFENRCYCKNGFQQFRGGCIHSNVLELPYFHAIAIGFLALFVVAFFSIGYLAYRSIRLICQKRKSTEYKKVVSKNSVHTFSTHVPMEKTPAPELKMTEDKTLEELNLSKTFFPNGRNQRSDSIEFVDDPHICIAEDLPFINEKNDSTC